MEFIYHLYLYIILLILIFIIFFNKMIKHSIYLSHSFSIFFTVFSYFLQLTREYNIQCCCLYYPVLKQHIQYDFEPCDNDPIERFINIIINI